MRRFALPGAVLLALVAVFAVAWGTRPGASGATVEAGQAAAVSSITRSCPPSAPRSSTARISMVALPSQTAAGSGTAASTGAATFSAVLAAPAATTPSGKTSTSADVKAKGAQPVTVSTPGVVTTVTAPGDGGTAVAATGKMAEGFEAEQSDSSGTGLVSCTHPGSDMWFAGTGESDGATQTRLYLMNTGNVAASVDVTILTDTGQQDGLNNAITVAPGQFVTANVTPYVPGSQALALHVQTTVGQVAASVWQGGAAGGAWLPQAAAPATTLVVPGLTVAS